MLTAEQQYLEAQLFSVAPLPLENKKTNYLKIDAVKMKKIEDVLMGMYD